MLVSVSFRHMDPSPSVEQYAADKLQHVVSKYVAGQDIDSQVVFSVERYLHIANFTININGLTVKCVEKTDNMYASIDKALEKVERQVRRYKDKIRDHKPAQGRPRAMTLNVLAIQDEDADTASFAPEDALEEQVLEQEAGPAEAAEAAAPAPAPKGAPLLARETFTAPLMTVEDAIMHLNLRGEPFFVFTNTQGEHVNIVYRREDGYYAVLEPEAAHPT